jgi:hypothetical protein
VARALSLHDGTSSLHATANTTNIDIEDIVEVVCSEFLERSTDRYSSIVEDEVQCGNVNS